MKTVLEYYKESFRNERPTFIRVMKAVPADRADYRPHPKSMSAAELLSLLAQELRDACELIDTGQANWTPRPTPPVAESIASYEKAAADLEQRLESLDEAKWTGPAKFLANGHVAWETTLGNMLFGFLFDAVHHRGQLSTHLRPMGAKVPSIYGPSGDDPGPQPS